MTTDAAPQPSTTGAEPLPKLLNLARLLARQAAREVFAEITADGYTNRLPIFQSETGDD